LRPSRADGAVLCDQEALVGGVLDVLFRQSLSLTQTVADTLPATCLVGEAGIRQPPVTGPSRFQSIVHDDVAVMRCLLRPRVRYRARPKSQPSRR
jgi:hypothetical protein